MTTFASPSPSVWKVFTPTMPARLAFVERESVNEKLVNALRTPGKQLVVYGHTGSGKTTLVVNKLQQLYEDHITSRCVRDLTFEAVILDAFDQLNAFYEAESKESSKTQISGSLSALYSGIRVELGRSRSRENTATTQRFLPPQLTVQNLARLLGAARRCWVLEDFHKLLDSEKLKMAQALKVFMDMADEYPELKIITLGAVNTAREVISWEPEMNTRVAEVYVPLMEDRELCDIIRKGETLLNVRFPTALISGIVRYSSGLAAVCHQLCLNICVATEVESRLPASQQLSLEHLNEALQRYVDDSSDTLKAAFDRAFREKRHGKYSNGRLIVRALTRCEQEGAPFGKILAVIRDDIPEYPKSNLTRHLRDLQTEQRGALLSYDSTSGTYRFADPIYRVFAMTHAQKIEHQMVDAEILFDLGLLDTREVAEEVKRLVRFDLGK
jgi:energy-coupling factor transporter ATP-binding protein EcfA2